MFTQFFQNKFFWVIADVTGHNYYADKDHHYFTLVDKNEQTNEILASVQTVSWKNGSSRIKNFETITGQKFKNNIHVLVKVSVEYTSKYGLKLILNDINPEFTIGKLEQERLATLNRLVTECPDIIQKHGEEYRTYNKNLSHQSVIQKIAVVGSSASAGYQDFMHTLDNNPFKYKFYIDTYFGNVQGENNAKYISSHLHQICNNNRQYDAVVIVRGGGADIDFLIFNQYELCKQIAGFPIPVITGIGHQKNETIVDLLVHTNTKTPTKAAEFIIAHNRKFEEGLLDAQKRIVIKTQTILKTKQDRLSNARSFVINKSRDIIAGRNQNLVTSNTVVINKTRDLLNRHKEYNSKFNQTVVTKTNYILFNKKSSLVAISQQLINKPKAVVQNKSHDLQNTLGNFSSYLNKYFQFKKGYVAHCESMVRALSPTNILKKGFAIIYQDNKIITKGESIKEKSAIKVRLTDYEINATTTTKKQIDGDEFNL